MRFAIRWADDDGSYSDLEWCKTAEEAIEYIKWIDEHFNEEEDEYENEDET